VTYALKTTANGGSVDAYIAALPDAQRRDDCRRLVALFSEVTGHPPAMWGPSIVGFDAYRYRHADGKENTMAATGFSSRKPDLAIYLSPDSPGLAALLPKLGKHRMGKSCLSVRRLADVDLAVLKALVADAYAETKRRHPD
jgi:hypothetical protein